MKVYKTIITTAAFLLLSIKTISTNTDTSYNFQDIVDAICTVESNNNPRARGSRGERGIMQISRRTWDYTTKSIMGQDKRWRWKYDEFAFQEWENITVGSEYLKYLYAYNAKGGDNAKWEFAIRAFNAGPSGAKKGRGFQYLTKVKKEIQRQKDNQRLAVNS